MKLKEIYSNIFEAKQVGTLYHFTNIFNIFKILDTDKMMGTDFDDVNIKAISFTRNKNFANKKMNNGKRRDLSTKIEGCVIVNGNKLSNNYRIEPFNYFSADDVPASVKLQVIRHNGIGDEQEERVIKKDITNIHKYIIGIQIMNDVYDNDEMFPIPNWLDSMGFIDKVTEMFPDNKISYNRLKEFITKEFDIPTEII